MRATRSKEAGCWSSPSLFLSFSLSLSISPFCKNVYHILFIYVSNNDCDGYLRLRFDENKSI